MKHVNKIYVYLISGKDKIVYGVEEFRDEDGVLWIANDEGEYLFPISSIDYYFIDWKYIEQDNVSTT